MENRSTYSFEEDDYPKEELARVAALVGSKDVEGTTPKVDHNAGVALYIASDNDWINYRFSKPIPAIMSIRLQCLDFFLHIFGLFDALSDLLLISNAGLTGECFMQMSLEVLITKRVVLPQIKKLCVCDVDLAVDLISLRNEKLEEAFKIHLCRC